MADRVTETTTIAASPEVVLGILLDFPRYPEWARDLKSVEVLATDDRRSAALWHGPDPGAPQLASFPEMLAGLLGTADATRKMTALAVIPAAHPTERHWYLAAIGTRPRFQGTGSGPRVLQPVLDRCDAAGLPAYLESSNVRNVPFYERHGFVAMGIIQVPDGGPALTPMWREPR